MAENVQTLQWIIGSFEVLRSVTKKTSAMDPAIKVTLSFGRKEMLDDVIQLHPETGAELWIESFSKTFSVSHQQVGEFIVAVATNPAYQFEIPTAVVSLETADSLIAGPIYALTKFMLTTGKWEF